MYYKSQAKSGAAQVFLRVCHKNVLNKYNWYTFGIHKVINTGG